MCLLFLYVSANADHGKYRVILASNRDEYFFRPAKPAHFWEENRNVCAGMDMTPGKEGGTWLGASRVGRLGVLLNVSGTSSDPQKLGRGFIVCDYLTSSSPTVDHIGKLLTDAKKYNPFHLVTVDLKDTNTPLRHFCNVNPKVTEFTNGCYTFCNSSLERPYLKATAGKLRLEDIVSKLGQTTADKDKLVSSLFDLLQDEHRFYPDPVIDDLATISPEMKAPLSAICVRPPGMPYGTRTHTVILVDDQGHADFYERTLNVPLHNGVFDWVNTNHKFNVDL